MPDQRKHERRKRSFKIDEAKFDTQKIVTYIILLIFAAVAANVVMGSDQAERSTILQTIINFALIAVTYWLGASKQPNGNGPQSTKAENVAVQTSGDVTVEQPKGDKP